jgi:hypothetical protein
MVYRCLFGLGVVSSFVVALCSFSSAEQPNDRQVGKVASISSEPAKLEQAEALADEPLLPLWLDRLLSRIPAPQEPRDIREIEEELTSELAPAPYEDKPPQQTDEGKALQQIEGVTWKPPDIPPLYTSPVLEGEGVWTTEGLPSGADGRPMILKTVYRPSEKFPNAVVYMAVFDMSRLTTRFFVGNTEPGIYTISGPSEHEDLSKIVAITNAMWMQQHARGAGAIFRGQVVYPMVPGMATLVVYRDDSVDVLEWSEDIPLSLVKDARQLRYLIVKGGAVVEQVAKNGKIGDSEIGLGFLIDSHGGSTMGRNHWFLANRTAFGIREDGNLIFAMGHHVGTKDLAKAMVLAGCQRAIHGDANIHNIVCNFYFRDERNRIVNREKLSPEQLKYTLKRYDNGYGKDFFAFYEK